MEETAVDAVHEDTARSWTYPCRGPHPLASALRRLSSGQEVDETLQLAVDLAADLVPGCDGADVMFLGPGGTFTPVSTDAMAVAALRRASQVRNVKLRDLAHRVVESGTLD